ncbi:MAG: acyltransferase [Candidatus Manganitrophus sp.]|nr:MAG: acyltransferase [Candidatus Manganitrophus sp.]
MLAEAKKEVERQAHKVTDLPTQEEETAVLDSLYGLRGLAALAITLFHFLPNVKFPEGASFIQNYFGNSVQLFFVLSAFSLCYTTSRYVGAAGWIDKYFWRRFFRIAPPFWVVLLFFTVHNHYTWGLPFFDKTFLANFLMIFNFLPGKHESSVMAGWTIGVEVIFYAFFPMLMLLVNSLNRAFLFFVLSAISLIVGRVLILKAGSPPGYEHISFIANIAYFAAGILAYWIFKSFRFLSEARGFIIYAPVIAVLLFVTPHATPLGGWLQSKQADGIYLAVTFCFLTVWLALWPKGIFARRPLIWCGLRSYSIYLVHAVIVWRLTPVYGWIYAQGFGSTPSFFISMAVAMVSVLSIAEIFHRCIEKPSIRIGKKFESGLPFGGKFSSERTIHWIRHCSDRMEWLSRDRMVKLLAGGVAVFAAWIAIRYAGQPILESYGFRQTQTALSAFWMVREGWQLAYQTPVAGYPWAIPFEFPFYQSIVALVVRVSRLRLEPVGRLVSFAFLLACAWPAFGVVRRLALPKQVAWVFCALLWSSPIYLFWGRTFMIETAALFFAFAAVPYALDLRESNPRWQSVMLCSLFATLAALQKITTGGPVIIVLGCIWLIAWWRGGGLRLPSWKTVLSVIVAFGLPMLAAYGWVQYSDAVKMENLFGAQLTSAKLSQWNFGTLQQKLAFSTYKEVFWDRGFVLNASGPLGFVLIAGALVAGTARLRMIIAGGMVLFALPILIFTNLHVVHNYYQAGCMLFLLGTLAVAVAGWLPSVFAHPAVVPAVTTLLVICNLFMFSRGYGTVARRQIDASSTSPHERALAVGEAVRRSTSPDSGIVVFGNDWDSDIAFYSQRKSFTVPVWFSQFDRVLAEPARFLGNLSLGAVVICRLEKGPNEQIDQRFGTDEWLQTEVQGCRLLLPKNSSLTKEAPAALQESEER